jgi:hypothetical protein
MQDPRSHLLSRQLMIMPIDPIYKQLKRVAAALGWKGLKRWEHTFDDNGRTVVWYEAGAATPTRDCRLQINHSPIDQQRIFTVCVYAIRYRICSGWREFDLEAENLDDEILKLRPWVEYDWFQTPERRREFRKLHRECTGFTRRTIRETGVPGQPFYNGGE